MPTDPADRLHLLFALKRIAAVLDQPVQHSDMTGASEGRLKGAVYLLRRDATTAREIARAAIDAAIGGEG